MGRIRAVRQDQEGVEDIGTHDISNGHVGVAFEGADQADDEFRGGSAHSDDCKADDEFTDLQAAGDGGSTAYEPVGSEDDARKAGNQYEDLNQHSFLLRAQTFSTCCVWGNMSTGWTAVIS